MHRAASVLAFLLLAAPVGCGRPIAQVRLQAARHLDCPESALVLLDRGDWRWQIKGCGREVLYLCEGRDKSCRVGDMEDIEQEERQRADREANPPSYQPPAYRAPQPGDGSYTGYYPAGTYNPRIGQVQQAGASQYSPTVSPPPPPIPPPTPTYTPVYTPRH